MFRRRDSYQKPFLFPPFRFALPSRALWSRRQLSRRFGGTHGLKPRSVPGAIIFPQPGRVEPFFRRDIRQPLIRPLVYRR